jgi:phospholipid/cholesterol/gamma-HCH transport system substrate-binding protein
VKFLGKIVGLLFFAAFALGAAGILLSKVGTDVLPHDRYVVEADVPNAIALADAADVRQAGVRIGRVKDIKTVGNMVALRLEIDPKYGPFYQNATTLVRAKTIAEENYVEIDPGTPAAPKIPENGVIPISRNLEATQNDDVFSIFDRLRRENLRGVLTGTSGGLQGAGGQHLNDTLGAMSHFVDQSDEFAQILAQQRAQVARLVDSFGVVTSALGERSQDIQTFTRAAKTEAEAVAARDASLKATLATLPPLLAQARTTAGKLTTFSTSATPVMQDLTAATEALVPTIQDLGPASIEGQRALRSLTRFADVGTPMLRALPPFVNGLTRFTPSYENFVRNLNPFSAYIRPYKKDVLSWFANAGAATLFEDATGNVARVLIPISLSSLPGTLPPEIEALLKQFSGALDSRGSNPYPAPGTVDTPTQGNGTYTRVTKDKPYSRTR